MPVNIQAYNKNPHFGDFQEMLKASIPLVVRQKQLQQQQQQFQQRQQLEQQKIAEDAKRAEIKMAQRVFELKLRDMWETEDRELKKQGLESSENIAREKMKLDESEGEKTRTNRMNINAADIKAREKIERLKHENDMKILKEKAESNPQVASDIAKRIEDDIQQLLVKKSGIMSGQNITDEALGSGRAEAIELIDKEIKALKEIYKTVGGPRYKEERKEQAKTQKEAVDSAQYIQALTQQMDPAKYKGKIVDEKESGLSFKSNGKEWVLVK